jgi:hypothetical protein
MRARARVAGGVFLVTSPATGGLTVAARIPIPEESKEKEEEYEPHSNPAG